MTASSAWGLINDPGCCAPGSPNCPRKSLAETYGMDYCPGDDELLKFVGKQGYRDPACDFKDARGRPAATRTKASANPVAVSTSEHLPARWASANFPIRDSTPKSGES